MNWLATINGKLEQLIALGYFLSEEITFKAGTVTNVTILCKKEGYKLVAVAGFIITSAVVSVSGAQVSGNNIIVSGMNVASSSVSAQVRVYSLYVKEA